MWCHTEFVHHANIDVASILPVLRPLSMGRFKKNGAVDLVGQNIPSSHRTQSLHKTPLSSHLHGVLA